MHNAVIFDLDDTLYKEIDYVISGFKAVASYIEDEPNLVKQDVYDIISSNYFFGEDTFLKLVNDYKLNISLEDMIKYYRSHIPSIKLDQNTKNVLDFLKNNNELKGLLTDGRSLQQRNKINALGLNVYFSDIVISEEFGSEKPCLDNYLHFMKDTTQNNTNYFYIGDNPEKDFFSANKLGWVSICLKDNGQNIHKQNFLLDKDFLPTHVIDNILEILPIINEK